MCSVLKDPLSECLSFPVKWPIFWMCSVLKNTFQVAFSIKKIFLKWLPESLLAYVPHDKTRTAAAAA